MFKVLEVDSAVVEFNGKSSQFDVVEYTEPYELVARIDDKHVLIQTIIKEEK